MQTSGEAGIPAFLNKLWTLLEDPSTEELICWDPTGRSFHIYEQARFAKEVLPHYFKHNNIASFVRQLNMYGFRKVVNLEHGGLKVERDDMEFQHQYFIRGQEELLENIKRKVTSARGHTDDVKLRPDDVNKVLNDVRGIKGKQEVMNERLDSLKQENETLWREVSTLRQKHMKQQQIVNKLIQFLVTMVGNRPVRAMKRKMPLMLNDVGQLEQPNPKMSKLFLEGGQDISSYQLSGSDSGPQTLTIQEVTDSIASPSDLPQVPAYESLVSSFPSASSTQEAAAGVFTAPHIQQPGSTSVPVSEPQVVIGQPQVVAVPPGSQVVNLPQVVQQVGTLPQASTVAETTAPVAVLVMTPGGSLHARPPPNTSVVMSQPTATVQPPAPGPVISGNGTDLSSTTEVEETTNNRQVAVAGKSTAGIMSIQDIADQMTSNCKDGTTCHKSEVLDHVDNLELELDMLKDIMGPGAYNLDRNLLSGLFTPEAPLPPTPDALLHLADLSEGSNKEGSSELSLVGSELMAYNPQADDISKLFDLDMPGDLAEEEEVSTASLGLDGISGLNTPIIEPSSTSDLTLTSDLAQRRRNTHSMEEVD